ncbi:hypothetical protein SDRG_16488 [Saprolegnia diclina VS20]|uniref:Uncharacterized protein n=1 Tax=Saprolegnia diclina (strain VS20) TaxID=1156394 RepID=T0R0X1_SAPDV|nr:hypothetical protein SDRG_16488 [Saprolegnia diclina VS20]EQC25633.1 hypothetical protein SDRG_16488 [Saprolegnia diclina VS20]|eukprot:XP_008620924.1 hypothetical protein SDRG_16488 [Saprolegnia diclina VS20]
MPSVLPTTNAVGPFAPSPSPPRRFWQRACIEVLLGYSYILLSLFCGVWFLQQINPSFSNDLFWAHYNLSGYEAYLIDVSNAVLATTETGNIDLLALSMDKAYTSPISSTLVYTTYARSLALTAFTSIEYAVPNVRNMSISAVKNPNAQLCWVDFDKQWELAHTIRRQDRCAQRYVANAAVYYEAYLRNTNMPAFLRKFGTPGNEFYVAILTAILASPSGPSWLDAVSTALPTTSVEQEVAYWRQVPLTEFVYVWQNSGITGIAETLIIRNALGIDETYTAKNVAYASGPWTSSNLYFLLGNDWWIMQLTNQSLVRGATNYFGLVDTFEVYGGYMNNADGTGYVGPTALARVYLGPFLSIDALLVPVPSVLRTYYRRIQAYMMTAVPGEAFRALPTVTLAPFPPPWRSDAYEFYGGNILCLGGGPLPFVQESFSTDDGCVTQAPLRVPASRFSLLFARAAMKAASWNVRAICALQSDNRCASTLQPLEPLLASSPPPDMMRELTDITETIVALNVTLMQFATPLTNSSDYQLLLHPLLADDAWSFYGWLMLCDWVEGKREVVSFQGDAATMVLISAAYTPVSYSTGVGTRYLSNANEILFYLVNYMSAVLTVVGFVSVLYGLSLRGRLVAANLLYFNRLVGSVWVGRPILLLRGFAATLLLSTSPIALSTSSNGSTSFAIVQRSIFDKFVLTGEACWMNYVITDICLLFSSSSPPRLAQLATYLLWLSFFVLESVYPMGPTMQIERHCSATDMDRSLQCQSGVVEIGRIGRVLWLVSSQLVVIVVAFILGRLSQMARVRPTPTIALREGQHHLLVSSVAHAFVASSDATTWALDAVSCLLCGLVPLRFRGQGYLFDLRLWLLVRDGDGNHVIPLASPPVDALVAAKPAAAVDNPTASRKWHHENNPVFAVLGFVYIILAIIGSVSYFEVSRVNLANDLSWATFNMTGAHAFIANYLNEFTLYLPPAVQTPFHLDDMGLVLPGAYNDSTGVVISSSLHPSIVQYTLLNSTAAAIRDLRRTSACNVPWIFTAYCFVDFAKTWSVAATASRAARCDTMASNGAVYLEAILRNVAWSAWLSCGYGEAFDNAFGAELATTSAGQRWLATVQTDALAPLSVEVDHWMVARITSYSLQWQTFKKLGLINKYSISNAYGEVYPLTLQATNGSFHATRATSYKMYWGLANDLVAVAANATTGIAGQSLVRSSANFAYTNTSATSVLVAAGALLSPLTRAMALVQNTILGPFGAIDVYYVPVPNSLKIAVQQLKTYVRLRLRQEVQCQKLFANISTIDSNLVIPAAWADVGFFSTGGSLLCDDGSPQPIAAGTRTLLSRGQCPTSNALSSIGMSATYLVLAAVLSNLPSLLAIPGMDFATICAQSSTSPVACARYLNATMAFLPACVAAGYSAYTPLLAHARSDIQALNILFMQMGVANLSAPLSMYTSQLLDPNDRRFDFFAWFYLYDWSRGTREVVSFQGDVGNVTVLSDYTSLVAREAQRWELSTIVASYARACVQYVTFVMICVAIVVGMYILSSRGHVEGLNMLVLNRVGGIVWVGRPLLFVRSLTAVCLLSTGTLELVYDGGYSFFQSATNPWYKTWLAASEVTWLLSVVNDILMVITLEYTPYCATPNSLLVWLVAAILSATYPVSHSAMLSTDACYAAEVDFQLICNSATIYIGSTSRLWTLIGVVVACNIVVYVVVRMTLTEAPRSDINSLFLYAGARYLFWHSKWKYDDVYYLDKASAVLNGILPLRWRGRLYAFDIKLWRIFALPSPASVPRGHAFYEASQAALPLVE